jgi:hypothetical protein
MVTATYQELVASCAHVGEVIIRDTEGNDVVRLGRAALQPFNDPTGFSNGHIAIYFSPPATSRVAWAASPAECPFAVCPMPDFEACDKCPGPRPKKPSDDKEQP